MALRFRKTFTIFPGLRLNIAKNSISVSAGRDGATLNFGKDGVKGTVGLPGSGLSYSKVLVGRRSLTAAVGRNPAARTPLPPPPKAEIPGAVAQGHATRFGGPRSPDHGVAPPPAGEDAGLDAELATGLIPIESAPLADLTSPSLEGLHDMLRKVEGQRHEVEHDLAEVRAGLKAHLASGNDGAADRAEIARLQDWLKQSRVAADFAIPETAHPLWDALEAAFDRLRRAERIWDVTAARPHDGTSGAERAVEREAVRADFATWPLLTFAGQALRFENANGHEILIFPALVVIPDPVGGFALIDIRDLRVEGEITPLRETGMIPPDAVAHGTVADYGRLTLRSTTGLDEEWLVSQAGAAPAFASAFAAYQAALAEPPA